jgi:hypothetical protein
VVLEPMLFWRGRFEVETVAEIETAVVAEVEVEIEEERGNYLVATG